MDFELTRASQYTPLGVCRAYKERSDKSLTFTWCSLWSTFKLDSGEHANKRIVSVMQGWVRVPGWNLGPICRSEITSRNPMFMKKKKQIEIESSYDQNNDTKNSLSVMSLWVMFWRITDLSYLVWKLPIWLSLSYHWFIPGTCIKWRIQHRVKPGLPLRNFRLKKNNIYNLQQIYSTPALWRIPPHIEQFLYTPPPLLSW